MRPRQGRKYVLAKPIFTAGERRPWMESDPSTFLIDAGLWSACKESRYVVAKHYASLMGPPKGQTSRAADDSITKSTSGSSILPHQDLNIFQVAPDQRIAVGEALAALRPFFQNNISRQLHIAFEYDDTWKIHGGDSTEAMKMQPGPRACFINLLERTLCGLLSAKLYLIDYSAERDTVDAPVLFSAGGYELSELDRSPTGVMRTRFGISRWFVEQLAILGAMHWLFAAPMWTPGSLSSPLGDYLAITTSVVVLKCFEKKNSVD
ncbi:hypothetical protein CORC01_09638 [Colletotrichum orchidophilum]|uniref:Uncharacterized protein n=1 Tax=Colletotrichum orchidophilum TaxID=1209926 RepID=A0A1G4B143_9PEZI|nr:uncharacterized protein CORC01_09638 [Colletotrichum orchidophilum]OHE95114.1 hypothetical protein CORC01_09638 [Colletotrichum orchidophilum]